MAAAGGGFYHDKYLKPERLYMRDHPKLDEKWVQEKVAADPSVLGLGSDLVLRDKERRHPKAGRLDLLLEDSEKRRYEVELQLGACDESHIIRTIEYWDIERKRYPQYDHCAVLVAEDITSRFLNVLSLFNGTVPFIAIQMQALKVGEHLTLVFTTVLDELTRGYEEEEAQPATDRSYWENRGSRETLGIVDRTLEILRELDPKLELKYNKIYIGLAKSGQPNNFVTFEPRKTGVIMNVKLKQSDDLETEIEQNGLDTADYSKRYGNYRIRLDSNVVLKSRDALKHLMKLAYDVRNA